MPGYTAGQINVVSVDMIDASTLTPITTGTVNIYLQAKSGTNSLKYFKGSNSTYAETLEVAVAGTHQGFGRWTGSISAAAWTPNTRFDLFGVDSEETGLIYSVELVETPASTIFRPSAELLTLSPLTFDEWLADIYRRSSGRY